MKTIFIGLFFFAVVVVSTEQIVGGYSEVRQDKLASLKEEESFVRSEELARKAYHDTRHGNLGRLCKVYQQVVAGMNYKMVFETTNGLMEIIVFCQPWTDTYEVLSVQPFAGQL